MSTRFLNKKFNNEISEKCTKSTVIPIILITIISTLNIFMNNQYEKIVLAVDFIVVLTYFILFIPQNNTDYLLYMGSLVYCTIAVLVNKSGAGTLIVFFISILLLILGREIAFTKKQNYIINIIFFLCLLSLIIIFKNRNVSDGHYYSIINNTSLNPNGYATLVFAFGVVCHSLINDFGKFKFVKIILNIGIFGLILWMLDKTDARGSFGAYLVFSMVSLIVGFFNKKHLLNNNKLIFITSISVFASVVVVAIYLILFDIIGKDGFMILGKNIFTGREILWSEGLDIYNSNLKTMLFGFTNKHIFSSGYINIHNGFLTLLCNLSFVGFLSYSIMLVKNVEVKKYQKIDIIKFSALIGFVFLATFENMLLDGMYYFVIIPFMFNKRGIYE